MANVEVVALEKSELPRSVVEPSKLAKVELNALEIVVEPLMASAVPVAFAKKSAPVRVVEALERLLVLKFVEVPLVAKNLVRVVEAEKKLVVVELVKVFPPVQVLKSARRVEEAVLSVDVMVIGEEPRTVKAVQEVAPEQDAVVVAVA